VISTLQIISEQFCMADYKIYVGRSGIILYHIYIVLKLICIELLSELCCQKSCFYMIIFFASNSLTILWKISLENAVLKLNSTKMYYCKLV